MKQIKTGMLAFEITRRCNQSCAHCLKGTAQNVDMNKQVIDRLFRNPEYRITEMTHIAITGGEPTLVPNIIEYLVDTIINLNISITSHVNYLSNGLIYDEKIIKSLNKLMKYLHSKKECQDVILVFEISNDQFHKRPSKEVLEKYAKLPFLDKRFLSATEMNKERIINSGNAEENNVGGSKTYHDFMKKPELIFSENSIEIKTELLVAANGNIIPAGCVPFIEEDKIALGNVCETSFFEILKQKKLPLK